MPTNPPHVQVSLSLACHNVDRFVVSSLFCVRLYLKSYMLLCFIYFDGAEIKDTTTTIKFRIAYILFFDVSIFGIFECSNTEAR